MISYGKQSHGDKRSIWRHSDNAVTQGSMAFEVEPMSSPLSANVL